MVIGSIYDCAIELGKLATVKNRLSCRRHNLDTPVLEFQESFRNVISCDSLVKGLASAFTSCMSEVCDSGCKVAQISTYFPLKTWESSPKTATTQC